jgi:small basic protein
MSLIAVAG